MTTCYVHFLYTFRFKNIILQFTDRTNGAVGFQITTPTLVIHLQKYLASLPYIYIYMLVLGHLNKNAGVGLDCLRSLSHLVD